MSWKQRAPRVDFRLTDFITNGLIEDDMAKTRPEHHSELQVETPMDYAQHEATYNGFVTAVKWAVIVSAISAVILYFLIQP